jgi:hypothetical protein
MKIRHGLLEIALRRDGHHMVERKAEGFRRTSLYPVIWASRSVFFPRHMATPCCCHVMLRHPPIQLSSDYGYDTVGADQRTCSGF